MNAAGQLDKRNFQIGQTKVIDLDQSLLNSYHLEVMCQITILGQIYHSFGQKRQENELVNDMNNLYENGNYSDVVISVGDKEFKVHKAILMARSQFFANELNESETNRIEVTNIDTKVIDFALRFLYTGTIAQSEDVNWTQLLEAAEKFQLNGLKAIWWSTFVLQFKRF